MKDNSKKENEAKEMVAEEGTIESNVVNGDPENESAVKKNNTDADVKNTSAEAETTTDLTQTEQPMTESFYYMGTDSTAVNDIAFIETESSDAEAVDAWLSKVVKPGKAQKRVKTQMIQSGIALTENLVAESNKIINVAAKNFADNAIIIGTICLKLKELNRGSGTPWEVMAEEKMPFLSTRNRQKFMMLAKRTDCHGLTHLGVDRMEKMCSVTKASEGDNPIGTLLDKYQIPHDETSELDMADFKKSVDAAVASERLLKKDLEVSFDSVKNAINAGVKVDKSMIGRLKDIQKCEGNPETLLEDLATNQGAEDPGEAAKKRFKDFNTLSARLIKTVDYIIRATDYLDDLDDDTFVDLFNKIKELQVAANIDLEEEVEA